MNGLILLVGSIALFLWAREGSEPGRVAGNLVDTFALVLSAVLFLWAIGGAVVGVWA